MLEEVNDVVRDEGLGERLGPEKKNERQYGLIPRERRPGDDTFENRRRHRKNERLTW